MKPSDFYVGQRIRLIKHPDDTGTITEIVKTSNALSGVVVQIAWDCVHHHFGDTCQRQNSFDQWEPLVELTKEEKIKARLKSLWNNSNWIKKNPHLAY